MTNEIILIAGVDYPEYTPVGKYSWKLVHATPDKWKHWRTYCERWAKKAAQEASNPRDLRITLFDFTQGTRESLVVDRTGRLTPGSERENYGALTPANYRYRYVDPHNSSNNKLLVRKDGDRISSAEKPELYYFPGLTQEFGPGDLSEAAYVTAFARSELAEKSISITDVYDYLCFLGSDKKRMHTVTELHFFTHAWWRGPILVNSLDLYERIRRDQELRDPLDKDARAAKDFRAENLGKDCLSRLPQAFVPQATIFVWGCLFTKLWKKVIQEILSKSAQTTNPKTLLSPFTYTTQASWGVSEDDFHDELGNGPLRHQSARWSVESIRQRLLTHLGETYMQRLAVVTKTPVIGALLGTYTDYDRTGKPEERFLHIPMGARTGNGGEDSTKRPVNFTHILEFYRNVVGIEFDLKHGFSPPFGRGYGIFHP